MNKMQGFQELKKSGLPAVPWQQFDETCVLDSTVLWTVRSAVREGDDQNLPRAVGVTAEEATSFANQLMQSLPQGAMVLYYPFFVAIKSGVIEISPYRTVIEAVAEDLWNLVTHNKCDISVIFEDDNIRFVGDDQFLTQAEMTELIDCCTRTRRQFQLNLNRGQSIFLEWSYSKKSDIMKNGIGEPELIFYEIRAV